MKTIFLLCLLALTGCAGRVGNPVAITQPEDYSHQCATLTKETDQIKSEIARLTPEAAASKKNNDDTYSNPIAYALIFPLFSGDRKHGEQVEIDALRARLKHLELIYTEKSCKA